MSYEPKCKICRSGKAEDIEFCRYFLDWSYKLIIETFCEDIDELSGYNLSTHFNRHTEIETKKFWRQVKEKITPEELKEIDRLVDAKIQKKLKFRDMKFVDNPI